MAEIIGYQGFLGSRLAKQLKMSDAIIVNCAAKCCGIEGNLRQPASMITENLKIAIDVFEKAVANGCKRVINFGSTCCYSPAVPSPFGPYDFLKDEPEPTNGPYAMAKRATFSMSNAYSDQYGMDNLFIVLPNLYGPGCRFDDDSHVIPAMIRKFDEAMKAGRDFVTFFGTGMPEREFLYIDDAAKGIEHAIETVHSRLPVHVTSGQTSSIFSLAFHLATLMDFEGKILWDRTKPDGQLIRMLQTGHQAHPSTPLREGLEKTIEYYRSLCVRSG